LSLSFGFPHQNPVYTSTVPKKCYMPRPPHSSRFHQPSNIGWEQIINLLIMYFSPFPINDKYLNNVMVGVGSHKKW
jgi:hypothetical protein